MARISKIIKPRKPVFKTHNHDREATPLLPSIRCAEDRWRSVPQRALDVGRGIWVWALGRGIQRGIALVEDVEALAIGRGGAQDGAADDIVARQHVETKVVSLHRHFR